MLPLKPEGNSFLKGLKCGPCSALVTQWLPCVLGAQATLCVVKLPDNDPYNGRKSGKLCYAAMGEGAVVVVVVVLV